MRLACNDCYNCWWDSDKREYVCDYGYGNTNCKWYLKLKGERPKMHAKHSKCYLCKNLTAIDGGNYCRYLCDGDVCEHYQRVTNGDRIRQMSNEEMVDFLGEEGKTPFSCPPSFDVCVQDCHKCWRDWLNSEYKEIEK